MSADRDYDLAAEQAVLGCALTYERVIPTIVAGCRPEDFSPDNRPWFLCVAELFQDGKPIDPVTVLHAVRSLPGTADGTALRAYAMELMDRVPSASNLESYLEQIRTKSRLRRLWSLALQVLDESDESHMPELIDRMSSVSADRKDREVQSMTDGWVRFGQRHTPGHREDYLCTGLSKLDRRVRIRPGNFVIIGGYPSDGKTALALQMSLEMGKRKKVGFFSLETDNDTLMDRMAACISGVEFGKIQDNTLSSQERLLLGEAMARTTGLDVERISASGYSVAEIRAHTKARGYQVIFIDYLQLVRAQNARAGRYEQVTQISMDLHTMAQQLGVAVFALSQLSRPEVKSGKTPPPTMRNLRESGQIEQDADVIFLLSEAELTSEQRMSGADVPIGAELRLLQVAKNKNGQRRGNVLLQFSGARQRMEQFILPGERNQTPSSQEFTPQQEAMELPDDTPLPF